MRNLNKNEKEKLKNEFYEKTKKITEQDLKEAIIKGKEKINSLAEDLPRNLERVWQDIKDMWQLIVDYYNGEYNQVPWGTIAAIVVALLYFISPIDLIPDMIPVFGYIDDVFVISLALKFIEEDLDFYREWRAKNKKKEVIDNELQIF